MDEEDQEVIDDDYHKLKDDYQISNHIWNKLYKLAWKKFNQWFILIFKVSEDLCQMALRAAQSVRWRVCINK